MQSKSSKRALIGILFIVISLVAIFLPILPNEGRYYSLTQLKDLCSGFFGQLAVAFSQAASTSCNIIQFGYYGAIIFGIAGLIIFLVGLTKQK